MPVRIIPPTPSAYVYPLLIKHLLHAPMMRSPDQEIVYRDLRRHTFREFRERIGRLASGLARLGVDQGDVVAVLEWDSDRYHECYFAIPMMGAVMPGFDSTHASATRALGTPRRSATSVTRCATWKSEG